jgi:hypothetical protein
MGARAFLIALCLAAAGRSLAAQELLDQGVFVMTRGGAETGRITYAIRASPGREGHPGLLVVSTAHAPGRQVEIAEELTDLVPTTFQQTETADGRVVRRVAASLNGRRFSARASSADADLARERPVRGAFVILADDDCTAYYFLPHPDSGAVTTVTVFLTRDLTTISAEVAGLGGESITVAGRPVASRRFVLRLPGGDDRPFWITPSGSLLRIALPALALSAERTDLPAR